MGLDAQKKGCNSTKNLCDNFNRDVKKTQARVTPKSAFLF